MTVPTIGTVFVYRGDFINPMMTVESADKSVISYKKARSVEVHTMPIAEWSRDVHRQRLIVIYEPQNEDVTV